ncbi:transcription factor Ouib-like isoform X2 [Pieris brassicae]|nr:transcription factor Ouib-like isoform X2 [Pieris brassicae]
MSGKVKGPIIDPAFCRCCRSIKRCRVLTTEYDWRGGKEIYSDMFMDVFGLLLSHLDGDNKDNCICATCVGRLREASAFREQVLMCEQLFLNAQLQNKECLTVEIKGEAPSSDDDNDNLPLALCDTSSIVKEEKQPEVCADTAKTQTKRNGKIKKITKLKKITKTKLKRYGKMEIIEKKVSKKKDAELDHDEQEMAYENTITLVNNSYICPFRNRISIYYCYYCRDQFTNPEELREHTLSHNPKELFRLSIENKKLPKIDITRVDCRLCDKKIDNLDTFKHHITDAHNIKLFPVKNEFLKFRLTLNNLTCTECNNVFPYFDSLTKHMITHFGTFTCDICGACFLEKASLRTHINKHFKVEMNFPCEICGKNLKSKYSMRLHIATVHEKKPTVNCYKCDACFLSYALRNRHLIEVHGDRRTFPCKLCDKVYNRRKTLMEHHRRNHLKVFRHQCDMCDQRFYLPSRLKEHMATHTGDKNFRCDFCEKCYPRLQSLQQHMRSHTSN